METKDYKLDECGWVWADEAWWLYNGYAVFRFVKSPSMEAELVFEPKHVED